MTGDGSSLAVAITCAAINGLMKAFKFKRSFHLVYSDAALPPTDFSRIHYFHEYKSHPTQAHSKVGSTLACQHTQCKHDHWCMTFLFWRSHFRFKHESSQGCFVEPSLSCTSTFDSDLASCAWSAKHNAVTVLVAVMSTAASVPCVSTMNRSRLKADTTARYRRVLKTRRKPPFAIKRAQAGTISKLVLFFS